MSARTRSTQPTVASFIAALDSPRQAEMLALRELLLQADPSIGEEVKWNAPSFHAGGDFATIHWRAKNALLLILHLGVKTGQAIPPAAIADPLGLLRWLGPDRASVSLTDMDDLGRKHDALTDLVRQWIRHLPTPAGTTA